jgi:hypothetical protein
MAISGVFLPQNAFKLSMCEWYLDPLLNCARYFSAFEFKAIFTGKTKIYNLLQILELREKRKMNLPI